MGHTLAPVDPPQSRDVVGAERGRAEVSGGAGGPGGRVGGRGRRALWGPPGDGASLAAPLRRGRLGRFGGPVASAEGASLAAAGRARGADLRAASPPPAVGAADAGLRAGTPRRGPGEPLDGVSDAGAQRADRTGPAASEPIELSALGTAWFDPAV